MTYVRTTMLPNEVNNDFYIDRYQDYQVSNNVLTSLLLSEGPIVDKTIIWRERVVASATPTIPYDPERMYCLQWLIPVLLIPKPVNPALLQTHVMFMALYLIGFFLERKPCTICSLVFLAAVFLICYSGIGNCLLWSTNCDTVRCDNG